MPDNRGDRFIKRPPLCFWIRTWYNSDIFLTGGTKQNDETESIEKTDPRPHGGDRGRSRDGCVFDPDDGAEITESKTPHHSGKA